MWALGGVGGGTLVQHMQKIRPDTFLPPHPHHTGTRRDVLAELAWYAASRNVKLRNLTTTPIHVKTAMRARQNSE